MSSERDARPRPGFASQPQPGQSRGLYGTADAAGTARPAPGRSTLTAAPGSAPSGPRLSGDDEKVLLAALRLDVPEGDHVRAWDRFDRFMSWLPRLSPTARQHLLLRLERPMSADELARLFHQVLRPAWRTKALEHLRAGGGAAAARQTQAPSPTQAPAQTQATDAGPWEHLFGQASTKVSKLGRVQAKLGRTLRERPDPDSAPSTPAPLPFNARVMVLRRTTQPTANQRWCYITAPEHGATGFCEERYLAMDPPEPNARLRPIEAKEKLARIARDVYGEHIAGGNDERLYVQGLYEANKDRAGVSLTPVQLSLKTTLHRREAEEETLKVYRGVEVLAGLSLWIPSHEFMQRLKASGAITSGSSEISKVKRAVGELVDDAIESVTYAGGFLVGLLEGAWSAIVDLFQGAAQMVEAIAKTLYHLVTANLGRIQAMLMGWVDKMSSAWEHRGQLADQFLKKWNAPSGWDRGQFQGEVLGWVMMTVLIILATAGAGAAANAGSLAARFPQVVQLLKTVDAVGDVTTYLGGALTGLRAAGKLPDAATDLVKSKLGKAARTPDADVTSTPEHPNTTGGRQPATVTVRGHAQGPRLKWARNLNGAVRTIDESIEIARRHGVEIPDDILLRKVSGKFLPKDTHAQYFSRTELNAHKTITWEEFYDRDLDQLLVRVEDSVFHSDEAIVAIIGHEMHELNNLRRLFEESGGALTYRRLHFLISPGIKGNLHDQAWDVADRLVAEMRKMRGAAPDDAR